MVKSLREICVVRLGDICSERLGERQMPLCEVLDDIFFQAAHRQKTDTAKMRREFHYRWLGVYLTHCSDQFYVARRETGDVVGYLAGCVDTGSLRARLDNADDLDAFANWFGAYPAHLHVNVDPRMRNYGIGSQLVLAFVEQCRDAGVTGVHVITAAGACNCRFYEKLGFDSVASQMVGARELAFLGRKLAV